MAKVCCSCCLLDAIFTSSDDQFKACPKHYFSDQAQGYKLERIKIPINNESKKILNDFIVTLKQEFKARIDELIKEKREEDKKYKKKWEWLNEAFNYCSRIFNSLQRKKFVRMKLIFSPFEYLLTQSMEKAQQYTEQNWNRVDLVNFRRSVKAHVFDFNYFQFENQKYMHGWTYKSSYNQNRLFYVYIIIFLDFIKISEYEMAYELYQNLSSWLEFYDHSSIQKFKKIFDLFSNILNKIIRKESYSKLYEKWNRKKSNLWQKFLKFILAKKQTFHSSKNLIYWLCYILDLVLDVTINDNNIFEYYINSLSKAEYFSRYYPKSIKKIINQELGLLYYGSKNYTKSIECFNKSISLHKERTF